MSTTATRNYTVPGMTCGHCVAAITDEVTSVPGVSAVEVDLDTKIVSVTGTDLSDAAIRDAIVEAGFDLAG